jgi:hypothetical protein
MLMRSLAVVAVALLLAGCPPVVNPVTPPDPPPVIVEPTDPVVEVVPIEGSWVGLLEAPAGFRYRLALDLRQEGDAVTGQADLLDEPVPTSGEVEGRLVNDIYDLVVVVTELPDILSFVLRLTPTDEGRLEGLFSGFANSEGVVSFDRRATDAE